MLPPIELNHEPCGAASEVRHVRPYWELTEKFRTLEASATEIMPEAIFRIRALAPQFARNACKSLLRQRRTPSSQPSPRWGEGVSSAQLRPKRLFSIVEELTLSPQGRGQGERARPQKLDTNA
jgi:hypothetical protein